MLYKTTQQHLRSSNAYGKSIQRGLENILKFKNKNMSKFRSNNTSYLQQTNIQNKAKRIVNTEIQNYQQRKTNKEIR